jgi:serine protease SohB
MIIMEMTNLQPSIPGMSNICDQVSFLISQQRAMNTPLANNSTLTNSSAGVLTTNSSVNLCEKEPDGAILPKELEILVLLESPGGSASDYGLAAEQIARLRKEPGIKVTICVDKVAASGGYMIACMSSPKRLFAAPFAMVGSIGVVGSSINIHNTLQNYGVKSLVLRGGKDKAPIGLIGEITKDGIAKYQDMIDQVHAAFKRHVAEARPEIATRIDEIATGGVWLGSDALDVGLVDRIVTSDEYIGERLQDGARVLKLVRVEHHSFLFQFRPKSNPIRSFGFTGPAKSRLLDDLERVASRFADVLDELPGSNDDPSNSFLARAHGISRISCKFSV